MSTITPSVNGDLLLKYLNESVRSDVQNKTDAAQSRICFGVKPPEITRFMPRPRNAPTKRA